jgi:membrane-bound lytic murein transglycosylase D
MKRQARICALLAAGAIFLAGCDDVVSSKQAKAHPPATTPAPPPSEVHETVPFLDRPVYLASFQNDSRPAIDILVAKVQASFSEGQQKYKAGHFDKARVDFDRAMDLVVQSGFQADFDPRLSDLIDQLGETLHSYELNAERNAEEDEEPAGPPAPIDAIAEMELPKGDSRLVAKVEQELISVPHDLPLTVNDSVLQYLNFFTTAKGRAIVEHGLGRAGRYNDMIRRVLRQEGVPQDLIYLAQAESAFQPAAVSRAGARGLWQFMPFRGEEYDLDRNYWVDERSDPEKATRAAARHMRDLYDMFGDWYLVMAAYNSGPMNVVKAIERTGYADFWDLQRLHALPKQTQNYVPIIIAMALVAKAPALYGVQVAPEKPAQVDTIKPGHPIDLHLVADASGADVDDLRALNPELLRGVTPNDPKFELNVPAGTAEKFELNIQQVPAEKWTSWRLHSVGEGESLADIARRYRVTIAAIESANHLQPHASLPAGFLVNVPTAPPVIHLVSYKVQRGDSLEGIAGRFDVTVAQLKKWNKIRGSSVPRGSRLRIYAGGPPDDSAPHAKPKSAQSTSASVQKVDTRTSEQPDAVEHRVKRGETLYSIARAYGTTVASLRQSNPFLASRTLAAGDVLKVYR